MTWRRATLQEALKFPELVIIALPLSEYSWVFEAIGSITENKDIIVTDIGGVKSYVQELADKHLAAKIPFIGGHHPHGRLK